MLEVLYDTTTKEVRAWNADMSVKGKFKPKESQKVVIFPIGPPNFKSDVYHVNLVNKQVEGNPDYVPPEPAMDYKAEILALKEANIELKAELDKLKVK